MTAMDESPPPDHGRFEDFYRRGWGDAVRWATALVGSRAAGEDIAQDAFARLAGRFDSLANPSGYLRTAIVNGARDAHRSQQRRGARELRVVGGTEADLAAEGPIDATLLRALAKLPYEQRATIVLRYWADWDEAAIADALGCRPATVRSHAKRGLDALRGSIATNSNAGEK